MMITKWKNLKTLCSIEKQYLLLNAERLKERLPFDDMEDDFEPVTENQKQDQIKHQQFSEKPMQALKDSTQTTKQAIEKQIFCLH